MDYKILTQAVTNPDEIKALSTAAEAHGYDLYAGMTSSNTDRWAHDGSKHYKLTADNAYLHEGELYAKTTHFAKEAVSDTTTGESTTHEQESENETTAEMSVEQAAHAATIAALNAEIEELKTALADSEGKRGYYIEITTSIDNKIAECVEKATANLNEHISSLEAELEATQKKIEDICDIINQDAEDDEESSEPQE